MLILIILCMCIRTYILGLTVSVPANLRVREGDTAISVCAIISTIEDTKKQLTVTMITSDGTGMCN